VVRLPLLVRGGSSAGERSYLEIDTFIKI